MIHGLNHLGIVVKDIDDMLGFLKEAFGAEEISREEFPEMKQISSMVKIGEDLFELMEPTGVDGAAGKFLEEKGGGLHHVSLWCDDIVETCDKLEKQGLRLIGKVFEEPFMLAFIHPKSSKGILFEITEKPPNR